MLLVTPDFIKLLFDVNIITTHYLKLVVKFYLVVHHYEECVHMRVELLEFQLDQNKIMIWYCIPFLSSEFIKREMIFNNNTYVFIQIIDNE